MILLEEREFMQTGAEIERVENAEGRRVRQECTKERSRAEDSSTQPRL